MRAGVHHAVVAGGAAEAQIERAGGRGFGPAGVRRGVLWRVPPHYAQAANDVKTASNAEVASSAEAQSTGECQQNAGDARGQEVGDIVEARSRPAERAPAGLDVADHAVCG